jgi:predicted small metal-binding protein
MKTFTCGQVVPGCSASFSARDYEDLLQQLTDHARQAHNVSALPPEVAQEIAVLWQQQPDTPA